ncbi:hypothetical protein L798_00772 [Zootermopsis nevadensis]|uniref:Uncharacterized protein n=1 Tax=Zootermopsis nevadensis TaxID=136037 RepID=A0A067QMZ3_ZOONE|nr:hypothetical protein L798_00772 [Zootermopsis nevadensis]
MSSPVQAQGQYVVEWSEIQQGDILPLLTQQFVPSSYINGLASGVEGLGCRDDRPPSLFQCRIKLFQERSETWGSFEQEHPLNQIKADAAFVSKFKEVLSVSIIDDRKI